jgi:hypothetical protein
VISLEAGLSTESEVAKKAKEVRPWTATDIHKLKGLAKQRANLMKIAKTLKRTSADTIGKAHALGISLSTED